MARRCGLGTTRQCVSSCGLTNYLEQEETNTKWNVSITFPDSGRDVIEQMFFTRKAVGRTLCGKSSKRKKSATTGKSEGYREKAEPQLSSESCKEVYEQSKDMHWESTRCWFKKSDVGAGGGIPAVWAGGLVCNRPPKSRNGGDMPVSPWQKWGNGDGVSRRLAC